MDELNGIYIISKGRPQCTTAKTLERMDYPGEWFIVCGNNDETLEEYQQRWGDHVLVFDWYEEIKRTDTLDNFGFDTMASGAVPVRNATMRIAKERGARRHWQLDDDYNGFYRVTNGTLKKHRCDGQEFYDEMLKVAQWADSCGMNNCGIALGTIESAPANKCKVGKRVFNAHNLPCDDKLFTVWRGRMNDDLINAIETWRNGGFEYHVKYLNITMAPSQSEDGGLTDIYKLEGTVRKSAYPVLIAPGAAKLVCEFGRYHHRVDWSKITPAVISDKWRK